jgi:hypothetical protein
VTKMSVGSTSPRVTTQAPTPDADAQSLRSAHPSSHDIWRHKQSARHHKAGEAVEPVKGWASVCHVRRCALFIWSRFPEAAALP